MMMEFDNILVCPNCESKLEFKNNYELGDDRNEEGLIEVYKCPNPNCGATIEVETHYKEVME